jgi:tRNA/tmRNA/rRNA uracil-C5-methylase (TrmA/RlmC/RlmD family)
MIIFSIYADWNQKNTSIPNTHEYVLTKMVEELVVTYPSLVSVFVFENTGKADIVQGNARCIYGNVSFREELCGMTFEIAPKSFFQVNTL